MTTTSQAAATRDDFSSLFDELEIAEEGASYSNLLSLTLLRRGVYKYNWKIPAINRDKEVEAQRHLSDFHLNCQRRPIGVLQPQRTAHHRTRRQTPALYWEAKRKGDGGLEDSIGLNYFNRLNFLKEAYE